MSRAFQFGLPGSLHAALAPAPGSPPLPLKRMTSGTQAPGRPPICALVHVSIAGRLLRYRLKIGVLSAKLPVLMFAEIWVRRFHSQVADGVQFWWSWPKLNMSATPA